MDSTRAPPMNERYVVRHCPKTPDKVIETNFTGKGLAFAYAKRRVPHDLNGGVEVQRQALRDTRWVPTDAWRFYVDGHTDHRRL